MGYYQCKYTITNEKEYGIMASNGELFSNMGREVTLNISKLRTFDEPITIGNAFISLNNCFANSYFNSPITWGNNIQYMYKIFYNCYYFNKPITLPSNLIVAAMAFSNCRVFNSPITWTGDKIEDYSYMFSPCPVFNQPIIIGNNAKQIEYICQKAPLFDQSVTIWSNKLRSMAFAFQNCFNFNHPIVFKKDLDVPPAPIPYSNQVSAAGMFYNCYNFNQPIQLPNGIWNTQNMFNNCIGFHQTVIIPSSIKNAQNMFNNCRNYTVYFKPNVYDGTYSLNMVGAFSGSGVNNLTIYTNNMSYFAYYNTRSGNHQGNSSIFGFVFNATSITNGCYYAAKNITIYNNYI